MAGSGWLAPRHVYVWCGRWVVGLTVSDLTDFWRSFDVPTNDLFLVVARG